MERKALVIGDIILDEYIAGNYAKRVSDEGNPIFIEESVTYIVGGAGNVASNIVQAGVPTVLISVIGTDQASQCCKNILNQNGVNVSMLIVEQHWNIPVKTRYLVQNQEVFRKDKVQSTTIRKSTENSIINNLAKRIQEFSSIVIVDYQAGGLTKNLIQKIISIANQHSKRVISDSKAHWLLPFKGSYLIKMNHKELRAVAKKTCDSQEEIEISALQVIKQCHCKYLLITRGKDGMILLSDTSSIQCIKSHSKLSVVCTIGAGDIITAYLLAGIENNLSIGQCMALANNAAEIAVSMPMTTVLHIPLLELLTILEQTVRNGGIKYEQNSAWNQYWA